MKINVVLYHPEIPQNTGNIMRSCVGFHAKLHLIRPLGFKLDEARMRRAALDYFDYLEYEAYDDWDDFKSKNKGKFYYLTRYGHKSPSTINFKEDAKDSDIYLVFGAESTGIAYDILKDNLKDCYRIPTTDKIRSLNLSNCAAIMLFLASEAINDESIVVTHEPDSMKGENFIDDLDLKELDIVHREYDHKGE
ncbi:MAG: tRNA (cytidine(34)-2'-O)-methyltransferase [Acholeplasmatales bacterium]|jgi:tRNA (cytidine/uridine-2'-O-)-methyltransferase|nr:tRNA (cytidine(34)-2'-O)-methyltransferase [Acholeplasmatales bacterium]